MKKKFLLILLLTLIMFPFTAKAASISNVTATTPSYAHDVGDEFSVSISATFSGIEKWTDQTEGIFAVGYELEFDDTILDITAISSKYYDSLVFKDGGKYYVYSQTDGKTGGKCADNLLNCENYYATLTFKVKKAPSTSTTIKLNELDIATFKIDYSAESYTADNLKEATYKTVKTLPIALNKSTETASSNSIASSSKPTINNQTISSAKNKSSSSSSNSSTKPTTEKSANKYLKSLTIKDYKLDFKKDKFTYKLTLPEKVNSLNVIVEVEDTKSKYVITGADNLKENSDKVKIKVTAENGESVTYNILIERKETINEEEISKGITNKLNTVVYIVVGIVIFIIVIAIIVSRHNKKKLKELLEKEL